MFRQEDSWPPPIGDPAEEENGVVLALDVESRRVHVIYGMGRHNHENNVADPRVRRAGRAVRRRHVHERPTDDPGRRPARRRGRGRAIAAVLVHGVGTRTTCSPTRATSGRSSRTTPNVQRLLRLHPRVDGGGLRTFHQGAEEHRDREEHRWHRRSRPPTSATRCRPRTAAGSGTSAPWLPRRRHRSASTVPSGCSSTGASSTTSSTSSASRTSRTTSGRAWRTSSTSSTRAAGTAR